MVLDRGSHVLNLQELYGILIRQDKRIRIKVDSSTGTLTVNYFVNICGVSHIDCILEDDSIMPNIILNLYNTKNVLLSYFHLNPQTPKVLVEVEG